MKIYNLAEAAALLGISLDTLRRWRLAAGGVGARGSTDGRRVWLSRAEVAALARAHGRVLIDSYGPGAPGGDVVAEVAALRARVADLERWRDVTAGPLVAGRVAAGGEVGKERERPGLLK